MVSGGGLNRVFRMLSKKHQACLLSFGSLEVYKARNLFDKDKLEMFGRRIETADNLFFFSYSIL